MDHPRQGDSVAGVRSLIVRVARWQNIAGSRSSAGVRPDRAHRPRTFVRPCLLSFAETY